MDDPLKAFFGANILGVALLYHCHEGKNTSELLMGLKYVHPLHVKCLKEAVHNSITLIMLFAM